MASERTINEYDSTRIANAVDTLAENLSGYTGSTVTPTTAMKGKLPSQTVGDRIADALEDLATNVTASGHEILDATGTELTQRNQLQFKGLDVTDDSANGRTVVDGYNVKERIGKAGKNLIPFPYDTSGSDEQGITYSVGSVGQVTISGSTGSSIWSYCYLQRSFRLKAGTYRFSADATLTGDIELVLNDTSNNRIAVLYTANPTEFTLAQDTDLRLFIWINQSTTISTPLTIYPMIYDSVAFTDPTFEPYHPTVEKLDEVKVDWKSNGALGAKNFNSYPYEDTTKTENGLTFTDNGDGSITIGTGTASADTEFTFHYRNKSSSHKNDLQIKNGRYKISGCPSGGSNNTYYLELFKTAPGGSGEDIAYSYGDETEFTLNGDYYSNDEVNVGFLFGVKSGTVISSPITVKPQIRLASDPDDTFQPYAMTNRELTTKCFGDTSNVSDVSFNTLIKLRPVLTYVNPNSTGVPSGETGGGMIFVTNFTGSLGTVTSFNRILAILAFDNGNIYCSYGYGGNFGWKKINVN